MKMFRLLKKRSDVTIGFAVMGFSQGRRANVMLHVKASHMPIAEDQVRRAILLF